MGAGLQPIATQCREGGRAAPRLLAPAAAARRQPLRAGPGAAGTGDWPWARGGARRRPRCILRGPAAAAPRFRFRSGGRVWEGARVGGGGAPRGLVGLKSWVRLCVSVPARLLRCDGCMARGAAGAGPRARPRRRGTCAGLHLTARARRFQAERRGRASSQRPGRAHAAAEHEGEGGHGPLPPGGAPAAPAQLGLAAAAARARAPPLAPCIGRQRRGPGWRRGNSGRGAGAPRGRPQIGRAAGGGARAAAPWQVE
jgi:hypothetical protein